MTRVRLFAVLREFAGASEVETSASDVGGLLREMGDRFGPEFDRVARAGSVVVGDEVASMDTPLGPDQDVAVLPPVSGGWRMASPHTAFEPFDQGGDPR